MLPLLPLLLLFVHTKNLFIDFKSEHRLGSCVVRWGPRTEKKTKTPTPRGNFSPGSFCFREKISPLPLRTPRGAPFHQQCLGSRGGVHRGYRGKSSRVSGVRKGVGKLERLHIVQPSARMSNGGGGSRPYTRARMIRTSQSGGSSSAAMVE